MYEGQRDVLTIATGEWFGRGRLQEARVFGRASLALKVDRVIIQLSVCCQYTIKTSIEGVDIGPNAGVRESFMKFIIFGPLSFLY